MGPVAPPRTKTLNRCCRFEEYGHTFIDLYKIIIIGDSGVGKTGILQRFIDNTFTEDKQVTCGIDFKVQKIVLDGTGIKLQIWDTAGSERYKTMTAAFYRGSHGVIVAYDITKENTFENVKDWLELFSLQTGVDLWNFPVFMVGNKSDMEDARQVSIMRGEIFALKNGLRFYEVSARTGLNIDDMFMKLSEDIKAMKEKNRNFPSLMNRSPLESIKVRPPLHRRPKSKISAWFSKKCSIL